MEPVSHSQLSQLRFIRNYALFIVGICLFIEGLMVVIGALHSLQDCQESFIKTSPWMAIPLAPSLITAFVIALILYFVYRPKRQEFEVVEAHAEPQPPAPAVVQIDLAGPEEPARLVGLEPDPEPQPRDDLMEYADSVGALMAGITALFNPRARDYPEEHILAMQRLVADDINLLQQDAIPKTKKIDPETRTRMRVMAYNLKNYEALEALNRLELVEEEYEVPIPEQEELIRVWALRVMPRLKVLLTRDDARSFFKGVVEITLLLESFHLVKDPSQYALHDRMIREAVESNFSHAKEEQSLRVEHRERQDLMPGDRVLVEMPLFNIVLATIWAFGDVTVRGALGNGAVSYLATVDRLKGKITEYVQAQLRKRQRRCPEARLPGLLLGIPFGDLIAPGAIRNQFREALNVPLTSQDPEGIKNYLMGIGRALLH